MNAMQRNADDLLQCRHGKTTDDAGGSLGWKIRGSLIAEFEKVAFELEPSTTASPKIGECRTSEGYHVLMVEGRK
jgi:parvulin-like peptidyl-prolyl isomerase